MVPRRHEVGSGATLGEQVGGTLGVFRSRIFWSVMPATVFCQAAFLSIQTLWTGPWLRDVAGFERGDAAGMLLLIAVALVAGMIGFGMMSQRFQRRGISPERFMAASMASFCTCLAVISFVPVNIATGLWLLFGFLGGSVYLPFAIMVSKFPRSLAGRVSTALNVVTFSFAFILQWITGVIINQWPLNAAGGYATEGYVAAFTGTVILQVVGLVWLAANWRHVEAMPAVRQAA
jgi:predicted MFS family arabinose efflux permease